MIVFILEPKLEFEQLKAYRWIWPDPNLHPTLNGQEQQITQVYYKSGCGLIICSFTGFMEIYDSSNIQDSVWDITK